MVQKLIFTFLIFLMLSSCGKNGVLPIQKLLGQHESEKQAHYTLDYPNSLALAFSVSNTPPTNNLSSNFSCGDILSGSIVLDGNLNCSSSTDFALAISGQNSTFDANGFQVYAPNAQIGIIVIGQNQKVKNAELILGSHAIGVLAYNANNFLLENNEIVGAGIGVNIHADGIWVNNPQVKNNIITDSAEFGIYYNRSNNGNFSSTQIKDNDLSRSGSYAMHLTMQNLNLQGSHNNTLNGSMNGIYFSGGYANIQNWDLSSESIEKTTIMGFQAPQLQINNVTINGNGGNAEQSEMAIHTCEVGSLYIQNSNFSNLDVGIKSAVNANINTNFQVGNSSINHMTFAAIMNQSYDGTSFGNRELNNNDFSNNPIGIYDVPTVQFSSDNQNNNTY